MAGNARALFTVTGTPSVVEYGELLTEQAQQLHVHMDTVAAAVEAEIRRRAMADEHWRPYAGQIHVWADGETFVVGVRGSLSAQAEALEFGGRETPPRALLRPVLQELLPRAGKRFDRALDAVGSAL